MFIPLPIIIGYIVLGGISAILFCRLIDPVSPDEKVVTMVITVAIWPVTWIIIGILYICYRLTEKPQKTKRKRGVK